MRKCARTQVAGGLGDPVVDRNAVGRRCGRQYSSSGASLKAISMPPKRSATQL
ncbi:hypothetical protein PMO31116_01686 [Pandoraea morbifera]|uniref:Uncharacterized protein n=1 Tax=Pandoraea morbifera TaxID=2508300 RepID=A0A5E4U151_9BURK|nr:hypothetical protein PMO31116_01686 [Pandoraea morbifera]